MQRLETFCPGGQKWTSIQNVRFGIKRHWDIFLWNWRVTPDHAWVQQIHAMIGMIHHGAWKMIAMGKYLCTSHAGNVWNGWGRHAAHCHAARHCTPAGFLNKYCQNICLKMISGWREISRRLLAIMQCNIVGLPTSGVFFQNFKSLDITGLLNQPQCHNMAQSMH